MIYQPAVVNQLNIFHWNSDSSYTEANGHIEIFATVTTSTSQYHIASALQSSYFELMVGPSTFPVRYGDMLVHHGSFPNLQHAGNSRFPVPMIPDIYAASLSRPNSLAIFII